MGKHQTSSDTTGASRSERRGYFVLTLAILSFLVHMVTGGTATTASAGSVVNTPVHVSSESAEKGGNVMFQLAGYLRDSFVNTKNAIGELYTNHDKCKEIRYKQKEHRAVLKAAWEANGMDTKEISRRIKKENGGITYDEYNFLEKGQEDRGKLGQLVFMMFALPRFLPYAIMFYPDMLPSPFSTRAQRSLMGGGGAVESKWEMKSRERAHSVIRTLLDVEKESRVAPALSKMNPFGRGRTKRAMERMGRMGIAAGTIFEAPNASGKVGAELVLKSLHDELFTADEPEIGKFRLVTFPKSITKGLARTIEGQASALDNFLPNFMARGKIIAHLKKVTDADEFLVNEKVDLNTLNTDLLTSACSSRLIGGPGRTDAEMRKELREWLELAVVEPAAEVEKNGGHYNGNFARAALMCYCALDGMRDERSSSYLPRMLFQGQYKNKCQQLEQKDESKKGRFLKK